jgi:exonuclease III
LIVFLPGKNNHLRKTTWLSVVLLLSFIINVRVSHAQEKKFKAVCVAFYNLENLFDTLDDPGTNDAEFTPTGTGRWDSKKYRVKLKNLAGVIGQIGDELVSDGPMMVGLSEVENRRVIEDLVNTPPLKQKKYSIVHYDSPDLRGIDVAFIYQSPYFKVTGSKPVLFTIPGRKDFHSRDILVVSGELEGDPMFLLVNHWPSRSSGQQETELLRIAAADLCRKITDSLLTVHPDAKIIIMGDLNDDPTDISIRDHLKAKQRKELTGKNELYNPMWKMFNDGIGSLAYRDSWNLFDQIIVSSALLEKTKGGYHFYKAGVFDRKFLKQKGGQYAGYPFRTYAGGAYMGGYSDHFPVYVFLVKEIP